MKRRKSLPGHLSLLDLPSGVLVSGNFSGGQVADLNKLAAKVDDSRASEPVVVEPPFMKNGALILPPSAVDCSNKNWFCVCDPSGAYRDAIALLYGTDQRKGQPVGIICPELGQRWDVKTDYCKDCLFPFYRAARAYAADTLGCSPEDLEGLTYVTIAWRGEERPILRDVPHLGAHRARRSREEGKEVANG
ncbi:hypothetical protein [Solidesulfovibrio sp.]